MAVGIGATVPRQAGHAKNTLSAFFAAASFGTALIADFAGESGRERYAMPVPKLGSELVTNGRFDTDVSGWDAAGSVTIAHVAGEMEATFSSGGLAVYQEFPVEPGKLYRFVFDARLGTATAAKYSIYDLTNASNIVAATAYPATTTTQEFSYTFVAPPGCTTARVYPARDSATVGTAYFDNISVRKITGYRARPCTFDELFPDYDSGDDLAVLRDSDGKMKWRAHNFLTWSEDFTNAAWLKDNCGPSGTTAIAPDGETVPGYSINTFGYIYQDAPIPPAVGDTRTNGMLIRANKPATIGVRPPGADLPSSSEDVSINEEWQYVEVSRTATYAIGRFLIDNRTINGYGTEGLIIYVHKPRQYRSDLGGMVDNPDTGDSYVPTTDTPRFLARRNHHSWDGAAFVNAGLALEKDAGENIAPYSEDFTQWDASNSPTVIPDAATSPAGTGATALLANGTGGFQQVVDEVTLADNTDYCLSVFYEAAVGASGVRVALTCKDSVTRYFSYLSDGTSGGISEASNVNIEHLASGRRRISGVINSGVGGGVTSVRLYPTTNFGGVSSMVDGDGVFIWGFQIEEGSTPGSYIPTNGATVTRAPEALPIPAGVAPWHPDGVSISMSGLMTYADTDEDFNVYLARWLDTASDFIQIGVSTLTANGGQPRFGMREGGNPGHNVFGGSDYFSPGVNVPFNIASYHGPSTINGAMDGAPLTADNTVTALPDLTGYPVQVGHDFNGVISHFAMWGELIGAAGISEASA